MLFLSFCESSLKLQYEIQEALMFCVVVTERFIFLDKRSKPPLPFYKVVDYIISKLGTPPLRWRRNFFRSSVVLLIIYSN